VTLPGNVYWALFTLVAVFVVGGFLFVLVRGERVGTMRLRARTGLKIMFMRTAGGDTHIRLSVAREGGPSPTVQLRVPGPLSLYVERLNPAEAITLAQLLETASSRLRAP